ncbi:methyl-accepting chemotaxis protein [Paucibacter sp. DJ1R-11]|uniref:methyl-accepting chemotaxis protein n=1 Tax=Paucibacter sp. DJ1R-11 TaxID=2893556 RepID=UPI00296232BF|nr:methyl-accepting chemotaxis protein [Paucibacter sp. DJ1R-11]
MMNVSKRLALGFAAVLMILVIMAGIAMVKVYAIEGALQANSREHSQIQRYAINFRGSAHDRAIASRDYVLASTAEQRVKEAGTIASLAKFYADSAAPLEEKIGQSGDARELKRLYGAIQAIETESVASTQAVMVAIDKGDTAIANSLLWTRVKPQYVQWLGAINTLIDFEEARVQALNKVAMDEAEGFRAVMLTALALGLISGSALAWSISGKILGQLGAEPARLSAVAQRVAAGDLSEVEGAARATPGSVLASLAAMQQALARVVGQVRQASDSIATGSAEIAKGNLDLSQRTEMQASSLQVTAATMDELGGTVRNNSDSAKQADQLAKRASAVAAQGGEVVGKVVATMQDINESSRKIGDIISVIDGIAFQTNILALNAAVEAARAGEQGRGFAVVASEVRSLAQRSAEAAKEIKSLIGRSVEQVEQGSALVGQAGQTMGEIVQSIQRVSDIVAEITVATLEQGRGIAQVGQSVSQMDRSTQQNAALVEESAAAAESLRVQAQDLVQAVAVFRLRDAAGRS